MNVAFQALTQNAANKLAGVELALFKAGQILQALVVGQTGSGLTQLQIGDVLIEAQLPQPAQPGTTLQLQVKTGGPAPQMTLVSQQAPAGPMPEVARMPLPVQVANVVLPAVDAPVVLSPQLQAPQAAVQLQSQLPVPVQPQPAAMPPIMQRQTAIVPQAQAVTQLASQTESSVPAPIAVPQVSTPATPPGPAQVQPQLQSAPLAQALQPPAPVVVEQAVTPVAVQSAPPQQSGPAPQQVSQSPSQAQGVVAGTPPVAAPIVEQALAPKVAPVGLTTQIAPAPDAPEQAAVSPLLVAQAAPRVQQTLADMPKVTPVPVQVAPAAPALPPATPEQAVAQMAPEAMAKQNSVAPLLQSLAAVVAQPARLPEPIVNAALQVLAQRIVAPAGKVQAPDIEKAVARSGVFLEAALAAAAPVRGDAKAALLNLRAVLEKFLGGTPPTNPPAQRESPPLRELPPRAMATEPLPLPDAPRDLARALHSQTDAAISRVKLGQLAALPDAPNSARPSQPELRMELPFLIGQELVMAQLQIAQDGRRHESNRKRGWTMRFAMNFSQTGEVGAEVGLLGKSVNVALWAAEPETAEALNAALPDLARALEALGLDPGAVRIRSGEPEPRKIAAGHFVDAVT